MKYVLIVLPLFLLACEGKQVESRISEAVLDSLREDSLMKVEWKHYDSMHKRALKKIDEPVIKDYEGVIYRYVYGRPFDGYQSFFTVYVDTAGKAYLDSKVVVFAYQGTQSVNLYGWIEVKDDTVLNSTRQALTDEQYWDFFKILRGSYYWALGEIYPNGSGYLDGDYLMFECKSKQPGNYDSLEYHQVGIHVPFDGSITRGCLYLARISELKESEYVDHYLSEKLNKNSEGL